MLIEQIGLQGYVMDMINFGAIRFAIAPYWLILMYKSALGVGATTSGGVSQQNTHPVSLG